MLDSLSVSPQRRDEMERVVTACEANLYEAADFLQSRGIGEGIAREARLGVVGSDLPAAFDRFRGMLCLGYVTPAGVIALKFRQLEPERTPKYDAPSGQHVRLYNVAALHTHGDTVAICEGELDALVMTHVVGIPAVGVPGASNWQDHWARCFADFDRVLVIADHDAKADGTDPGVRHAKKVVKAVRGGQLVLPPAGHDLTEWVQRDGVDAVKEACGA